MENLGKEIFLSILGLSNICIRDDYEIVENLNR